MKLQRIPSARRASGPVCENVVQLRGAHHASDLPTPCQQPSLGQTWPCLCVATIAAAGVPPSRASRPTRAALIGERRAGLQMPHAAGCSSCGATAARQARMTLRACRQRPTLPPATPDRPLQRRTGSWSLRHARPRRCCARGPTRQRDVEQRHPLVPGRVCSPQRPRWIPTREGGGSGSPTHPPRAESRSPETDGAVHVSAVPARSAEPEADAELPREPAAPLLSVGDSGGSHPCSRLLTRPRLGATHARCHDASAQRRCPQCGR